MAIVKRPNSKYWYIQFQLNGENYIRSSKTTDKKVATQMEVSWRSELHATNFLGRKPRITLQAALSVYCESRATTANYRNLKIHERAVLGLLHGGRYLDEITSTDLERLKRDRQAQGVSNPTIKHTLQLVGGSIKSARKSGYQVPDLFIPEVKLPRHSLRYITKEEEARLLHELDPQRESSGLRPLAVRSDETKRQMQDAYDLVVLLLDTGARYSEVANIEWSRIDHKNSTIHLWRPKVQNETILFMTDRVRVILSRRFSEKSGAYVFSNKQGGPRGYASMAIRKAIQRAGLSDVRIHTLRHTHASRLVQNGMSVYEVREILGHTDIKTTMRYAHLEQHDVASRARDVMNRLNDGTS